MENDLTVKYYTKHRYGAGNTKKKKITYGKLRKKHRKLLRNIQTQH